MMAIGGDHMSSNRTGAAALGAALAVLLAGCSAGPPPPPSPATTGATVTAPAPASTAGAPTAAAPASNGNAGNPARCRTAELAGALGPSDAGAGSVYLTIVFTNTGGRTCVLQGFPGVSYVTGDNGAQVGAPAARTGAAGPVVSLAPGAKASAKLQAVNVHNFDEAACGYTPVRGLRVYPPDETAAMFLPSETTGCALTPPAPNQQLMVQPVQAG
jgi:hypothetical protein